jgi:hypothetical protein
MALPYGFKLWATQLPSIEISGDGSVTQTLAELKHHLLGQLDRHKGDTTHPEVLAAIKRLMARCPIADPAYQHDLLDGHWRMISAPDFPDGQLRDDGRWAYTLGRLTFNAFTPTDLQVAIDCVTQPVWPTGNGSQRQYDIVVEFTVIDERSPGLQGIVRNLGVCRTLDPKTLGISFMGGTLEPLPTLQANANHDRWMALFSGTDAAISPISRPTPNISQSLKTISTNLFLKLMFGLQPTSAIDETGQQNFVMSRSPVGKLTLCYLDDDLRITCGRKESWMVCKRA